MNWVQAAVAFPRLAPYTDRHMDRVLFLAGCVSLAACLTAPPVHPRALESNEYCANYIGTGDLTRAEVQCDLGLQFSPQYADLWVNKGLIALRRGQIDLAKEQFIKAIRYNPEQAQAYNNLGYVYYKQQQYGKAHDMFQRALKVNPDYTEARYNLGLAFVGLGKKDQARKEFRTIIAINDRLADPHHQLGLLALESGSQGEAIEEIRRAVELDPSFADAWMNLGNTYALGGRFQEAKDAYTSCLEADPNNAECRQNVAIVNRKAALLNPTLQEVEKNARLSGGAAERYQLAREYGDKGLKAEEERQYRKCVEADGRFTPCHYGLFQIYRQDRRDREAKIACKNVLKFASSDDFPQEVANCEQYLSGGNP